MHPMLRKIFFKNSILVISITCSLSLIFFSSNFITYENRTLNCCFSHYKFNAVEIHASIKWIFNPAIAQYSPKLIRSNHDRVILEALSICDYDNQTAAEIKSNAQFIVYFPFESHSVCLSISEADEIPTLLLARDNQSSRSMWRLRTVLDKRLHKFQLNKLLFAIVDIEQSKFLFSKYESLSNEDKKLLIGFHKPIFYDYSKETVRKQQVAHCVHMVRNIESERRLELLLLWLEIQKKLNYGKIRLYLNDVSEKTGTIIQKFAQIINLDMELVDYKFDYEFLCDHYIKLRNERPSSNISHFLLNNCRMFTQAYFDPKKESCINSHELACTNDCFTNLRHKYEYISNFDFDEFLFPRNGKTNDYRVNSTSCRLNNVDYDIYEYVSRLVRDYGANAASFHFEHVVFLDKMDPNFMSNILRYEKGNRTKEFKRIGKERFIYDKNRSISTDFVIHNTDLHLIEYIREGQDVVKCLNETIQMRRKINPSWNRIHGVRVNNRLGKSIFVSSLTELCDQHKPILVVENSQEINVETSIGFSSHFREEIEGFLKEFQQFPLNMFYFDIEFYRFLSSV